MCILIGAGCGLAYASAVVIMGLYFEKYRPLAFGIALAGNGVGNMAFPYITTFIIDLDSWRGNLFF